MKKFLTNSPLIKKLRSGEWEELSILCIETTISVHAVIKCTRIAGTTATYTTTIAVTGGRMSFIVSLPGGETFTLLSKMEAWIETYNGYAWARVTEIRTFTMDFTARKITQRIGWLNTLGGIDYYTFTGARSSVVNSDTSEYQKDLPIDFTVQDRGAAVLNSILREEFEVISDFETEENHRWLSYGLGSPEVWIIESGIVIPIMIVSKSAPVESDDMFQFKLKYRKANDLISQNG